MAAVMDDEALARALQAQFEREDANGGAAEAPAATTKRRRRKVRRTSRMQQQQPQQQETLVALSNPDVVAVAAAAAAAAAEVPAAAAESDEALAKRLQQEAKDEELARKLFKKEKARATGDKTRRKKKNREVTAPPTETASTAPTAPTVPTTTQEESKQEETANLEDDEAMARRLQQEMKDEELARKLFKKEKQKAKREQQQPPPSQNHENQQQDTTHHPHSQNHENHHHTENHNQQNNNSTPDPPAAVVPSPASPPATATATAATTPEPTTDEELARKLEQEMRDEELARRLNAQEARRRRRTSYLARKANLQKRQSLAEPSGVENMDLLLEEPAQQPVPEATAPASPLMAKSNDEVALGAAAPEPRAPKLPDQHHQQEQQPHQHHHQQQHHSGGVERPRSPRPRSKSPARRAQSPGRRARSPTPRSRSPVPKKGSKHSRVRPEQHPDLFGHDDEHLARKLDQEARDEILARTLNEREMRRVPVYHQHKGPERSGCCGRWTIKRILMLVVPIVIILAAVVGVAFAFGIGDGLPSLGIPGFPDEDPFEGVSAEDANRWQIPVARGGLNLELLNALTVNWEVPFEQSVSDWDDGNPDAVTLTTRRVEVDPACEPIEGKLKVCNGNYGDTRWRGINQVLLSNSFIITSVAKLNEFYLADADEAQRRYTMCHEIGHGFGLPHTDENFYNEDLGNCMDYTVNPAVNMRPDQSNYLFLFDLYGLVPRNGGRRQRQRGLRGSTREIITDDVRERMHQAAKEAQVPAEEMENQPLRIKTLHKSDWAEARAVSLGGDLVMVFHMLLADPTGP